MKRKLRTRRAITRTVARPDASGPIAVMVQGRALSGRHHQRTRVRILRAAHRLYGLGGYGFISMREIAKRLGFSAQAIYNYFPSKEAMVAAMVDEGLRLLEQTNPSEELPDALDNLRFMYVRYYEFSKAHPDYFTLLFMDPVAARNLQEPQLRVIQRLGLDAARRMQRCVDEGVFPADIDIRGAGTLMWSAVHGPAVIALTGIKTAMNTDEAAKDVMEAVIEALRSGTVARRPLFVPRSDLANRRV